MKRMQNFKCYFIFLLFGLNFNIHAQEKNESVIFKNALKLDLFPLYYDFFDYRKQIRIGLEYEKKINFKSFTTCNLDFGLFDDYKFIKYYDFFNQNKGMFSVEQTTSIKGFHLTPAYNVYLLKSKKDLDQGIFFGALMDFHLYRKKLNFFNSQTFDKTTNKYNQKRLGLGLCLGAKYALNSHLYVEIKTSFLKTVFDVISKKGTNMIKPLNAQWTDARNNFWWVSNIKIGYAF